jgi:hypothetical protein
MRAGQNRNEPIVRAAPPFESGGPNWGIVIVDHAIKDSCGSPRFIDILR